MLVKIYYRLGDSSLTRYYAWILYTIVFCFYALDAYFISIENNSISRDWEIFYRRCIRCIRNQKHLIYYRFHTLIQQHNIFVYSAMNCHEMPASHLSTIKSSWLLRWRQLLLKAKSVLSVYSFHSNDIVSVFFCFFNHLRTYLRKNVTLFCLPTPIYPLEEFKRQITRLMHL